MTFYKDILIVLLLCAAFILHTGVAMCDFFLKSRSLSKVLVTSVTVINILLHIFLILVMMVKLIPLDEAVGVILISVFFHTLLYFIRFTVADIRQKRAGEKGGKES